MCPNPTPDTPNSPDGPVTPEIQPPITPSRTDPIKVGG